MSPEDHSNRVCLVSSLGRSDGSIAIRVARHRSQCIGIWVLGTAPRGNDIEEKAKAGEEHTSSAPEWPRTNRKWAVNYDLAGFHNTLDQYPYGMEVINPRAALLSNYEVLTLLRELESDHLLRTKTALRVKKEEEAAAATGGSHVLSTTSHLEASENLRTIEVEAIGYLSANYLPTGKQTEEGITKLVKDLAPYGLTKAEKLQIVNLAPTTPVELYVIVEELEDRLGDKLDEIVRYVDVSLIASTSASNLKTNGLRPTQSGPGAMAVDPTGAILIEENSHWDEDADAIYDEEYFDDTGGGSKSRGRGREGTGGLAYAGLAKLLKLHDRPGLRACKVT
ncbi:hypothetical protein NLJ89_g12 [Agrocybe chaxingu]|uniref:DNA-directed RNA polymerase III subunit RPC9 n=1 Tax=Agrocybe chaxingu TaxID=84603 RepID=A0A9W8TFQ0_9AGAR|nr:hypothetical protein NLJ89_g12 [Agrocybe chaxingu]